MWSIGIGNMFGWFAAPFIFLNCGLDGCDGLYWSLCSRVVFLCVCY